MKQCDILLATINARYGHAAFGLRWLWANMGALQARTAVREFTLEHPPGEVAERLLEEAPRIVGLGVYIWNITPMTRVVEALRAARDDLIIVLGGPEVSHEFEQEPIFCMADYLIRGEADQAFAALAASVLAGRAPSEKVIGPTLPDLDTLVLPYDAYAEEDLARRSVYVEASRGCPFTCEFCLSSLDAQVREFPIEPFLDALGRLIDRGARRINFVDRTFNLKRSRVEAVLRFLLEHQREGLVAHFEIVPDRLDAEMFAWIRRFPPGALHLEAGVQTFNTEAQTLISRRQDLEKTEANLARLREETGALLHADLIAGLPGEDLASFGAGFDRLMRLVPHEIQVGVLKRLKGAPIARHAAAHGLVFSSVPPYEVLRTARIAFPNMQRVKRFARYFDLYYNSGNFTTVLAYLWDTGVSPYAVFLDFSDWIWAKTGRTHQFSLARLFQLLAEYLRERGGADQEVMHALEAAYHRLPGRKDRLELSG